MAFFLSPYGEDIVGGVHMVDTARLVEACVPIRTSVKILQFFRLHIGHTRVLIRVSAVKIRAR